MLIRVLTCLSLVFVQTPQTPAERDAAAVSALIERYFAALNRHDADTALGLWQTGSPGRRVVEMSLGRMLQDSNPVWTNVTLSDVTVEGTKARARLEFDVSFEPPSAAAGAPAGQQTVRRSQHATDVVTFVRDKGEWRIESEITTAQDLANRLLAAPDEEALARLLTSEGPRVDFALLQALLSLGGEASARSNFPQGIRATSLALRLAEAQMAAAQGTPRVAIAENYVLHGLTDLAFAYTYKPEPDYPKAIELLTRAQEIQGRNGDELSQGNTLQSRGNAYYASGDYSRALDDYQRALTLHARQNDEDGAARSRLGVGNVQFLFGQFDLAMDAYQQAQQAFERMRNTEPQPRALQGLARVYAALGDYAHSREFYTRALTLLAAASRRAEQAGVLLDIGHVCFMQGKLDDAEAQLNQALAIDNELKDVAGQGRAQFALGLLQMVRARYDEAIQVFTRSAEAFTRARHGDGLGQAVLARAAARFEQHDLTGALADYTASAKTFEASKNREGVARANVGLAMTYVASREAKLALDTADVAWRMAEQAGAPEVGWQARYESGRARLLSGEADRARAEFEQAIATLERAQLEAGGDADSSPPARRSAPYVALVEWYAARGDAAKALMMAEGAKRRVLQDLLLPYRFRLTRGLTVEQQREERRLFSQRVSLAKQARHERERPAPDAEKLTQLDTQLAAARTAAVEWDSALARDHFELAFQRGDANFNSATNLEQLAQQLTGVSAMVQFVVGDAQTTVLVATLAAPTAEATSVPALDVRSYAIDITRPQLAEQVARFNDAIERHLDTTSATARELYDRLLGPAREQLANRTQLIVVPDDALWILPFQALQTAADRTLDQDATITMLPSAAAWVLRPAATPSTVSAPEPGAAAVTLWAAGTISDVTPLQSTIALLPQPPLPSQQPPAPDSTTLAAWELFEHPLRADLLVVIDRSVADERIRLDQGRFGAMGLAWALQVAGVPRVAIARRALAADERDRILQQGGLRLRASISSAPDTDELHALAAFMLIGPPEPLPTGQPQPASQQ